MLLCFHFDWHYYVFLPFFCQKSVLNLSEPELFRKKATHISVGSIIVQRYVPVNNKKDQPLYGNFSRLAAASQGYQMKKDLHGRSLEPLHGIQRLQSCLQASFETKELK